MKEGSSIEIQLKATRGEDGTTAIVDITNKPVVETTAQNNNVPAPAPVSSTSASVVRKPKPAPVVAEVVEEVQTADVEPEPVAETVTDTSAAVEQVAEEADLSAADTNEVTAEPAAVEPTPARQSLFAGVKNNPA